MEHYRKKRVRFYEAEALPNEIKVNNSGRAPDIVSKAARKLKVVICVFYSKAAAHVALRPSVLDRIIIIIIMYVSNCMYLYVCSCVEERLVAECKSLNRNQSIYIINRIILLGGRV